MKSKSILIVALIAIFFYIVAQSLYAQTQSILLPIPLKNGAVINFKNPAQPILTKLPVHEFIVKNNPTLSPNPHNEGHLEHAEPSINEYYLGQHPMFCQSVVHDADLLFFIIDNNIYNRNGEAMIVYEDELPVYLLDGKVKNANWISSDNISGEEVSSTRFKIGTPNVPQINCHTLDPELSVFPIGNSCNEFGLFFSTYKDGAAEGASSNFFYRTIKIIDEKHAIMTHVVSLVNFLIHPEVCDLSPNRQVAVSKYRPEDNCNLVFLSFVGNVFIFKVDGNGVINTINYKSYQYNTLDLKQSKASELELIEIDNRYNHIYRVAFGLRKDGAFSNPGANTNRLFIRSIDYDYNTLEQIGNVREYDVCHEPSEEWYRIKGLEFSPNGEYIYCTFVNQTGIYCFPDGVNVLSSIYPASYYQYSEIELGRDGNMYFLYSNDDESIGGVSMLEYPDAPSGSIFHEDVFPEVENIHFSCDYSGTEGHKNKILEFADQIDQYSYTNIDTACCLEHIFTNEWSLINEFEKNAIWTWKPGISKNPFKSHSGKVFIKENVSVPAGKKLTLKNMELRFFEDAKIVLAQGATLLLENSTLGGMNKCGQHKMWEGIELKGNAALNQNNPDNQPRIILNNSKIENAICAINTATEKENGAVDYATSGGIIIATNSKFINCGRAVNFIPYKNF